MSTDLPIMLGSIGDTAYRLAQFARYPQFKENARASASALLLQFESVKAGLEAMRDGTSPEPKAPSTPPSHLTVAAFKNKKMLSPEESEALRIRRMQRKKYAHKKQGG